jgi:membrane peptidoglycan carboxypeptidase
MNAPNNGRGRKSSRLGKNQYVTKSGKTIKVNRSLGQKVSSLKDAKAARKATRLADLPKSRLKRFLYHFHPKRMYKYWFSRDGAIMALKITGVGIIAGFLLLMALFAYFRKELPNLRDISGNNIGGSIRYYDRTGTTLLFEDYEAVKRVPVKEADISKYVRDATVAIEDKDFFKHGGFDVRGIMRAGVNNAVGGGSQQGGSTITQQLVKLTQNWTKDRSYTRKAKELILSVELERSYSKQEILTGYLNTAPYGNVQYGVEAASRDYFQKSAKELTLDEASFLAAIPKSPSFYSPYGAYYKDNPDESKSALIGRQHYILKLMQEQGMITAKERDAAKKIDTIAKVKEPKSKFEDIKHPYFVLAAKKQLETTRPETAKVGGWSVVTTLDIDKQRIAEEQVAKGIAQIRRQGGDSAAFAAQDVKTGQMVALVGGVDFKNQEFGQFNYANRPLPPGSSFKPYDYVALIENSNNVGAGSVLYDTQGPVDGYPCTNKNNPKTDKKANCLWNYDFRYPGPVTLRYALGGSRNVPAIKAMLTVGIDKTIQTAEKLGLKSGYKCYEDEANTKEGPCYASSAIGDGAFLNLDEHVHAHGSLARNGVNIPQTYILKITNSSNKTIEEWKPSKGTQAVRPESAYIVSDMMSDPNASYFPAGRKPHRYNGWKFAMKTGTTNDNKDGWMMGFSPQYAAGVWVGYHSRQRAMTGTMESMTQPIWQGWMNQAHNGITPFAQEKPVGLQTLPAYVIRSKVGLGSVEPSPATDLFPSWYKQPSKANGKEQIIDKVSGKLATNCTPERAKEKTSNAAANLFSADRFVAGGAAGANANENDDVHKCDDVKPSISLRIANTGSGYNLSVDVRQGTHAISSDKFKGVVNYIVDGQIIRSFDVSGPGNNLASFNYVPDFTGSRSISAQIIDSVLYDGSSEAGTISSSSAGSGTFSVSSDLQANNKYKFTWTGATGTVMVYDAGGNVICTGSASSLGCPSSYAVAGSYARDGSGKQVGISGP